MIHIFIWFHFRTKQKDDFLGGRSKIYFVINKKTKKKEFYVNEEEDGELIVL